ncbi:MAG: ABC-type transport auxiliary lipoprotein family protein [Terriglobia bacterium]
MKRVGGWRRVGLSAASLLLAACGSAKQPDFYTLTLLASAPAAAAREGKQVGVAVPSAAHLLRQDRIVYFTHGSKLNYYHYHRWGEPPVFMLQSLLLQRLRATGAFGDVVPYRAQKGLAYVLRSQLLALEEVDNGSDVRTRFAIEMELVQQEEAQVVWTGRESCERPVATKTVAAVVAALNGCVEESLTRLTQSLRASMAELEAGAAPASGGEP